MIFNSLYFIMPFLQKWIVAGIHNLQMFTLNACLRPLMDEVYIGYNGGDLLGSRIGDRSEW